MVRGVLMSIVSVIPNFFVFVFRVLDNFVFSGFGLFSFGSVEEKFEKLRGRDVAILVSGLGKVEGFVSKMNRIHGGAYSGLRRRGYRDDQIVVVSNSVYRKGGVGVNVKPSVENLEFVLRSVLKKNPKSVVFHFIGHGHRRDGRSTMFVGLRDYFPEELYGFFVGFKGKKIFIFDQCFSGGFLKKFKRLKNSVVLASTKENYFASNKTAVEIDFWKRIGRGEEIALAYRKSAKLAEKKGFYDWLIGVFVKITSGKIGDFYFVSKSSSSIDIPRLNRGGGF